MNILGIDIGTGGTRAILIDETGAVRATETAEHPPFSTPDVGWAEQDPDDWWNAAVIAIQKIISKFPADSIGAIGLTGQMHGSVLLDKADKPLRPALLWCDQRTEKQCNEITETIGKERLIELVSNPAITGFTLPKLLWIREHEPAIWTRVASILLPKDYVRLKLSGDKAIDVSDASGTLLFDVRNRKWSQEMIEVFEIDPELLPDVFESVEITGTVSRTAATRTGLREGTPIVAGAGDNSAGAIGMGVTKPGTVSCTIGTSGVVFGVTEEPRFDARGRIHTMCHAIAGRWHNTGVTLAAGLSLKWFRQNFGGGNDYYELTRGAATISAGADGAIWLPYLMGERSPHLDPNARAAFVGLTARHSSAHLTGAVLEGVAFSLRDSLEIFKENGASVETIRLGGGGARSPLWCQIQADVYGQDVLTLQASEGAAFGAALLAAVGVGLWKTVDQACEKTVCVEEVFSPIPENVAVYDRQFEKYRRLYPLLRSIQNVEEH
ncbi:MAG: xylulokinase [Acidobacteria bacterium]|nr:MAG: xylulokinase [Acidobacteriota bacterium]